MKNSVILPSVYAGPVQWYSKLLLYDEIFIDEQEHYRKQTWRNRMRIIAANGIQDLAVPVHAPNHTPLKDVTINYSEDWQRQHWQSIRSAYGKSAFFEFYADYFSPFYENKKYEKLAELNNEMLRTILKLLKIQKEIKYTAEFIASYENADDMREFISPKNDFSKDKNFHPAKYIQAFEERHGFVANLSIIDLLCCAGPDAVSYIRTNS
jgi:hypothetical protein